MTSSRCRGVFIVENPKSEVLQTKVGGERIAQAVKSTSAYRKKKKLKEKI